MALVEYSSSSESDADVDAEPDHQGPRQPQQQRPRKRRRTSPPPPSAGPSPQPPPVGTASEQPASAALSKPPTPCPSSSGLTPSVKPRGAKNGALPPLPPSFHDLYASTVRTATADLPSLHHGRKRVIPHKEGNWPSHIYVEWHPSPPQHALLRSLLESLTSALGPALRNQDEGSGAGAGGGPPKYELSGFLESGLGAPQPLHVSLSRPFVLTTAEKDAFLGELVAGVEGCGVGGFGLSCDALAWHRSPDSERSFLVLRVRSSSSNSNSNSSMSRSRAANEIAATTTTASTDGNGVDAGGTRNPELSALLARCNDLVSSYGQPMLYAAHQPQEPQQSDSGNRKVNEGGGDAFHVSIAWSFASPTDEIRRLTAEVFARPEFHDRVTKDITIPVESIKAKIGNVVTNIGLRSRKGKRGRALFGEV